MRYFRLCHCLLWAVLLFSLSGCYRITLQSARDKPMMLSSQHMLQPEQYKVVRHFYHSESLHFVFGVPLGTDSDRLLSQVLDRELKPHQYVINLRLRRHVLPVSQINALLTLGIYLRTEVIIEGDILEAR